MAIFIDNLANIFLFPSWRTAVISLVQGKLLKTWLSIDGTMWLKVLRSLTQKNGKRW